MDPEALKREKEREREKLRQEILEEIKKEYYLKPKATRLEVNDILDKYKSELLLKAGKEFRHNGYSQFESIKQAIRKIVCLHFGVYVMTDITSDKYNEFREEIERVIVEYIGIERKK